MWRRNGDLPDVYHEEVENVYLHFVSYLHKHVSETSLSLTLNAAQQAFIAVWVANYTGYLDEAREQVDEAVSVFKDNIINTIQHFEYLEGDNDDE